jgi:uncharacterized protein involved in response to NO
MPATPSHQRKRQRRIDARRHYSGPLFFSQGFRPFFLGAGLWAMLALAIWIYSWLGFAAFGLYVDADWHIHEMLFGFASAAIAGFLLTAIPNWTGRLPVRGLSLAILFGLWLAGRIVMLFPDAIGQVPTRGLDSLFLIAFALAVLREIVAGKNWRNLKVVSILFAMAAANIWFHLEQMDWVNTETVSVRAEIGLLVLLVALIGGRIIPSFTRNTLRARGSKVLPSSTSNTDRFTLMMTLVTGISFAAAPDTLLTAILALVCAVLHVERLTRWRGLHVLFEPMLWILHLAYLWIAIGFALLGASLVVDIPTQSAAIHAFTTGAFSSMILAVMTRASRGHTGRALNANWATTALYVCISLAALTRVLGSLLAGVVFHQVATGFWVAAFGLFVVAYWPVLTGPDIRLKGK